MSFGPEPYACLEWVSDPYVYQSGRAAEENAFSNCKSQPFSFQGTFGSKDVPHSDMDFRRKPYYLLNHNTLNPNQKRPLSLAGMSWLYPLLSIVDRASADFRLRLLVLRVLAPWRIEVELICWAMCLYVPRDSKTP